MKHFSQWNLAEKQELVIFLRGDMIIVAPRGTTQLSSRAEIDYECVLYEM